MRRQRDWSLYLVTDRPLSRGRPIEEIVRAAVRGGVSAVQLREKTASTREFLELARLLKRELDTTGIPLIINDRIDIALASDADGAHVGQHDMPYEDVRRLLGQEKIVGISIETMEDAIAAEHLDVDYFGVSPIFSTPTKTDTLSGWGIDGLRRLRAISKHQLVAIGGLNAVNAGEVIRAGADGIAAVSALCSAEDTEIAALELRRIIDQTKFRAIK
jgi:thiamine-phosphate pyrophosphorylase